MKRDGAAIASAACRSLASASLLDSRKDLILISLDSLSPLTCLAFSYEGHGEYVKPSLAIGKKVPTMAGNYQALR